MAAEWPEDCLVCRKHHGFLPMIGGPIFENDLVFISHAQLWGEEKDHYLGHLFVETKRHVAGVGDLAQVEAEAIGWYTSLSARALVATLDVEHVYTFVFGDHVPHLHVHIIGRYPGAPREYWGSKVDEWPEAPRGAETEIKQLSENLRKFFRQNC